MNRLIVSTVRSSSSISVIRIAASGLADVFGIKMAESGTVIFETTSGTATKKLKPAEQQWDVVKVPDKTVSDPKKLQVKTSTFTSINIRKSSDITPIPKPLTGDIVYAWRSSIGETQTVFATCLRITAASISQWQKKGAASIGMLPRTLSAMKKGWKDTHP